MKKPTFFSHYNSQKNRNTLKLLIVADCKVDQCFVDVICHRLNNNSDILYIDTSRATRKNVFARHLSYLILAKQTYLIENKYVNIIFWQQFIGLYWNLLSHLKIMRKPYTFLLPLIYKPRKGLIGKIYKLFFSISLSNPALTGAICLSSKELMYYKKIFPKYKSKIFFIPYGQSTKTKNINIYNPTSWETHYFFSGGTSNRDYSILMSVASKIRYNFVIACTRKDIAGMDIPENVRVFHNAYGEKFDLLMKNSYAVLLTLENPDISSGQIVLLKAMEMGKPIVATKSACIIDYVNETCAFLTQPKNLKELQIVLNYIIENPEEAQVRAFRAKKRYQENYTIQKFASSVAELIADKIKINLELRKN